MLKTTMLSTLAHPAVQPFLRPLRTGVGTILMMHRFGVQDSAMSGHSAEALRAQLAFLRRQRYALVSVSAMIEAVRMGRTPPTNAVAFTVDDGYADFGAIAAPIFAEFDCPATVFVTTGPVDSAGWFWWDRVEYAFDNTRVASVPLDVGLARVVYQCNSSEERRAAAMDLAERLKLLPNSERVAAIDMLCALADVDTSGPAPHQYAPMSWDDLRRLSGTDLVDVAPHTVTHPILSRASDAEATYEICESWRRLRTECPSAVPIFCYPNGTAADFSSETISTARAAGLIAALTTRQDHIRRVDLRDDEALYRLPRFPCPPDVAHLSQVVSGLERAKAAFRSALRS